MKRRYLICLAAAGALALAGTLADVLPRLTEDIVTRMLPVMRAEAEQIDAAQAGLQEFTAALDEHAKTIEDIGAGKIDPLAWLKSKSKCLIVPGSAEYKPKLSRWVSSSYFFNPVALFSFGIEAPERIRKASRSGEEGGSLLLSGQDIYKLPGGQKLKAVEDEVTRFYRANKFVKSPVQHFFTLTMESPDSSVVVLLEYTNMFAGSEASEGVPDGPTLWLWLSAEGMSPEDVSRPRDDSVQASGNLDAALARAGMTYDFYQSYLGALSMAKSDAADPSALEMTVDSSSLPAEQAEVIKDMQDFYAIRRSNLKVYRQVADKVDSLLTLLGN
jgi:hypothetical protein